MNTGDIQNQFYHRKIKEDYHLIALTNGNQETAEAQLKYAKIDEYFNGIYSVDVVGKFKPHPSTYKKVLKDYKLKAQEAIMVAAHGWDIAGAQNAGLKTVFVARKGKSSGEINSDNLAPMISAPAGPTSKESIPNRDLSFFSTLFI